MGNNKGDSFFDYLGCSISSIIGLLIFSCIFGFLMYCMDSCAEKIGII